MATHGGTHIELDGLVFGYDTGQGVTGGTVASRHYRGRPAENLFQVLGTSSNFDQNVTFPVNGTGTFQRVANGTRIGNYLVHEDDVVYRYNLGGTGCHYHGNDYPNVQAGTQITLTIDYYLTPDVQIVTNYLGNFEILAGVGGSWGAVNSETGKWHRTTLTRTATATGTLRMLMYPGACGGSTLSNQGAIYYRNPTVTMTPHQVPFRQGTLSNTEALLDLTGNNTIDLTNVSFNTNGGVTFDGTDDGINLGNLQTLKLTGGIGTVEAIVKFPSTWTSGSQYPNLISKGGSAGWDTDGWSLFGFRDWGGPKSWGFGIRNGATSRVTSRNNCPADVYLHIVATIDGSTIKLYENGSLYTTNTQTINPAANNTNVYIGRGPSSQFFPGDIPVAKVYERPLSAEEVMQHYKSYKNRFNL